MNDTETLTALAQIAPSSSRRKGDWRETFTLTADALGVADQAQTKLAELIVTLPGLKPRLKTGYLDQDLLVVCWARCAASLLKLPAGQAHQLGMKRPANQDRRRGPPEPVSLENIDQIDADWIFFGTPGQGLGEQPSAGNTALGRRPGRGEEHRF